MYCKVKGCPSLSRAKGYCKIHYKRNLRHGSPDLRPPAGKQMRDGEWTQILSMELLPDSALNNLVGSTGPWRDYCAQFKKNLGKRITHIRKMTFPQQCAYYRGIAYVRAEQ